MGPSEEDFSALTLRVGKLEAIEEIRKLKMDYAKLCDNAYPPQEISEMFTEDAIWDGGPKFGLYRGRQEIYNFFDGVSGDLVFAMHFMMGDTIEVADDLKSAAGAWQLLEPVSMVIDGVNRPLWLAGLYDDKYVKGDEGWQFSHVKLDWKLQARNDVGWAEQRIQI